jgi:hypothetical protein
LKKAEVYLNYQPIMEGPPVTPKQLYTQSCSNDEVTISTWKDIWVNQTQENKKHFGSFADRGIGKHWNKFRHQPVIVAGSGPSLKGNAAQLKDRGDIPLISCLHNFHYLEDLGAKPDFYVTLDAGPVTIEEVTEGGTRSADEYWALTKDRKLLAFIGSHPDLLKKWQGEVYFFNAPIPGEGVAQKIAEIEPFYQFVSSGGNVLGASVYIAKSFLGAGPIIYVGADFCFSYDHKFHAWGSKYDKELGHCVQLYDVYGIPRLTWQSYANFKGWFEYVAMQVPGIWINASEGGCLGSYAGGNIAALRYMDLLDVYKMFHMNRHIECQVTEPSKESKIILF